MALSATTALGYAAPPPDLRVADAIAASCAFPPYFEPMAFDGNVLRLTGGSRGAEDQQARDEIRGRIRLTDGGVYDNLALEPVWKNHSTVLVSDGGSVFRARTERTVFGRLLRIMAISSGGGTVGAPAAGCTPASPARALSGRDLVAGHQGAAVLSAPPRSSWSTPSAPTSTRSHGPSGTCSSGTATSSPTPRSTATSPELVAGRGPAAAAAPRRRRPRRRRARPAPLGGVRGPCLRPARSRP